MLQTTVPAPADRAVRTACGCVGSFSPVTSLREPATCRYSARTSHPTSQPSCGYKLMPCFNFPTSKQSRWNFRCICALLDCKHKICIRTSSNLLPQLAGTASPANWPVMSLRDSQAAGTQRWGGRNSPSASLSGLGCLPGSVSAWTYAARPCGAREPGCRACSWPRKHESITRVKSV